MPLNNDATLVIGSGNFFLATEGKDIPSDISDFAAIETAGFTSIGHTSLEDIFNVTSEGGDATVLGTLQNKSLRTTYSKRSDKMRVVLQQFDKDALKLYFGANMIELPNGLLGVPDNPAPTKSAFLAVFIDGTNHFAFYAPKAELFRGDDFDAGDTESLAGLPIDVTPVNFGTNDWTYAVTPLGTTTNPLG